MERRGRRTQATGIIQLLNKEEDMMKEAKPFVQGYVYAQRVECEEPCEGRLSRTVLWEGEGETPSLYSTHDSIQNFDRLMRAGVKDGTISVTENIIETDKTFDLWTDERRKSRAMQALALPYKEEEDQRSSGLIHHLTKCWQTPLLPYSRRWQWNLPFQTE